MRNTSGRQAQPGRGWLFDLLARFLYFFFHTLWFLTLCAAAFALAAGAGYWVVRDRIGGREVVVPSLLGKTPAEALDELRTQNLELSLRIEEEVFNLEYEPDVICRTVPASGQTVKAGATIRLHVSRGSEQTTCPDLRGRRRSDLQMDLDKVGLALGHVGWVPDDEVQRERVIAQDPPPGTAMTSGQTVNVLVSEGPPGVGSVMPNLLGLSAAQARTQVARLGRDIAESREAFPDAAESGKVVEQSPSAGSLLDASSRIVLTYGDNGREGGAR